MSIVPRVLWTAALLCTAASAQTVTGTLDGHIVDPTGAVVPNVDVIAKHMDTGLERRTTTNETGYFHLSFVPLGKYEITAQAAGFATVLAKDIEVTLNKTTTVPITLKVSTVQESVTVSDIAPLIDVASGQIRRSIDETLISTLPAAGRNFLGYVTLFPGFQTNPTSGQNNYTLSSGSSVSFNGTGTRGTTFMTDGVSNDDGSENQNRQAVNISTIQEMQILTNNFSPEFGRGFGAVVLVQTKSGSNDTHGEAYWYHQNSAFNARGYFANAAGSHMDAATGQMVPNVPKGSSKNHRLGGTVGGHILRDRLFYFGSIERFWAPGTSSLTSYILPPEWRTPRVDPSAPDAAARKAWIESIIARFPADVQPNNAPVSPWAYTTVVPRSRHDEDYSGRVDWRINDSNLLYGRYQLGTFFNALEQEIVKGENVRQDHRFQSVGLTHTHIFTPTTTGEFRFGFGRRRILVDFLSSGDYPPIVRFNYPGFSPIIGNASSYPQKRFQNDFQYVYNLASQIGSKHTLKIGADIRRTQLNDWAENYNRGFWQFGSQGGFNNMENFLRGVVNSFTKGYGPAYVGLRTLETNFYVQDDYRILSNLTLNLGARFEYVGEPIEVNNLYNSGYGADKYVEPRFGFAWSPQFKDGWLSRITGGPNNTSVRGGFGLFHGRIYQSIFSQIGASTRFNPPNAATLGWTDPNMSVADPTNGFVFKPGPPTAQVSLANVDPNLHMPYTEQWNLTVERNFRWDAALQLSYLGNRGIGLLFYNFRNRSQFPITCSVPTSYAGSCNGIVYDKIDPNLFNAAPAPGYISLQQSRTNQRRPDGRYGLILETSNGAWSYYHGLQVQYTQRTRHGLTAQIAYTWSKNIDTGSEATSVGTGDINAVVSEFQGARSLRGPSRLSQPQRFTASYLYDLPLWRDMRGPQNLNPWMAGLLGRTFGGWQISGATTFGSGNPFTVFLGYDLNGDGVGGDRPDLVDASVLGRSIDNARINPGTGRQYGLEQVPITAFAPSAGLASSKAWPWFPGTPKVGTLGRNTFWSHGQNNWDFALIKNMRIYGERHKLQFRAEMFNLMNRVQFDFPNFLSVVDTSVAGWRLQPRFGEIIAARNSPRTMQMSLQYRF